MSRLPLVPAVYQSPLEQSCKKARDNWAFAAFSDANRQRLERYFTYELATLDIFLAADCQARAIIAAQVDHLLLYFGRFIDSGSRVPGNYQSCRLAELSGKAAIVTHLLEERQISAGLKDALLSYIQAMFREGNAPQLNYGQLSYLELLIRSLIECLASGQEGPLEQMLIRINYNHLGFLLYCQRKLRSAMVRMNIEQQVSFLQEQLPGFPACEQTSAYDPAWPALSVMMNGWLKEELAAAMSRMRLEKMSKLPLNLSVAQLACYLRLFVEEGLLATANLSEAFKFLAANYSTKRREALSPGGLSKEFYSTGQVTAAVVRDQLQRMVIRINRHYFPVWVAFLLLARVR